MAKSTRSSTVKRNKAILRKKVEVFEKKRLDGILEKLKQVVEPPAPLKFEASPVPKVVVKIEIEDDEEEGQKDKGGDVQFISSTTITTTTTTTTPSTTTPKEKEKRNNTHSISISNRLDHLRRAKQPKKERISEMMERKKR